jgi:putative ABC transport system ATP-binding protein
LTVSPPELEVAAGAFVAVMGQSGSGKTTLLNLLAGIDRPSSGEIWLDGERLDTLSEARLAILRRQRIGLIFQAFNLLGSMSALENVMLPALLVGCSASEARKRASVGLVEVQVGVNWPALALLAPATLLVAVLGAYLPARRAARVSASAMLRYE